MKQAREVGEELGDPDRVGDVRRGQEYCARSARGLGLGDHRQLPAAPFRPLIGTEASAGTRLAIGIDSRTRGFDAARILELVERALPPSGLSDQPALPRCLEPRDRTPLQRDPPPPPAGRRSPCARRDQGRARTAQASARPGADHHRHDRIFDQPAAARHARDVRAGRARGPRDNGCQFRFRPRHAAARRPRVRHALPCQSALATRPARADGTRRSGRQIHRSRIEAFAPSFSRIRDLVLELVPHYAEQGRAYLTIAFGCTGGRHRSVYTAERLASDLRAAGYAPSLIHRNLDAPITDATEVVSPKRS